MSPNRLVGTLVGRRVELAALEGLLTGSVTDRLPVLVLEGPTGVGKSALIDAFLSGRDRVEVRRATAVSWETGHRYAVLEQVGVPLRTTPADPVDAAMRLLEHLGAGPAGEVVIVVEGASDADPESLQALHSAVRRSSRRLAVVVTARPGSPPDLPGARHLILDGLAASEVRQLAETLGVPLTARSARLLRDHTRGNPGRLRELLAETPRTTWEDWRPELPATRRHAAWVEQVLADCPEPARALLEAVAVLGDGYGVGEAGALADLPDPVPPLDAAVRAGLLAREVRRGRPVLTFPDPMTRAAIRRSSGPGRMIGLHARAAGLVTEEAQRLQHRVAATTSSDQPLADELTAFAQQQAAEGAWGRVAEALIDASRLTAAPDARVALLVRAVDALVGAGRLPEASLFVQEVESFSRSASADATLGYLAILQGRRDEAGALLDRAWAGADEPSVRALVSQRRVLHALGMCNGPELVQWADRALELAGPDEPVGVEAAAIRGLGLGGSGRSDEARAAYEALATRVTTGAQAQRIRMGRGWLDLALDDPLTARQDLEGAVPTRYWMGSIRISLWAQAWLARTLFTVGEWEAALGVVARAAAQVSESGHGLIRPLIHWTGVQINALRGDDAAAREHLRRGAATPQDYPIMQIPAALASAQLAEATADYEGALRSLHPVSRLTEGDVSHEPGLWPWVDVYGNALVMTGRVDEAEQFLDPHRGLAQARGHRSGAARIGLVEGRIRGARGDVEGATEAFEEALEQLDELPMPYDRARVGFAYGQTLRRAARRRDADAVMQVARDAFATLGATSYVVRCDRELKAGGLNASRSTNVGDLTPQELAVADLVASGRSNKQAAEELFLSVKTIQYHLTRIYAKLGIRSRTELAARHTPSGQDEDN